MNAATNRADQSRSGHTILASVAALVSVIAASSCCLPIVPFVFAASLAGSSTILTALRPYLLGTSVLSIAYGFYQARQSKQCSRKSSFLSSALLWLSAFFVFVSIFSRRCWRTLLPISSPGEPMTRKTILSIPAALLLGAGLFYFYGGHTAPATQPASVTLTPQTLSTIEGRFQRSQGQRAVAYTVVPDLNGLFAGGLCNRRSIERIRR